MAKPNGDKYKQPAIQGTCDSFGEIALLDGGPLEGQEDQEEPEDAPVTPRQHITRNR